MRIVRVRRPAQRRELQPGRATSAGAPRGRLALRVLLWLAPFAAWFAAHEALTAARDRERLALALERLVALDPASASLFEALAASSRQRDAARVGLALSRALAAQAGAAEPLPGISSGDAVDGAALDRLGVSLAGLLHGTLTAGRFAACRELAQLGLRAGRPEAWPYLAAAHVEAGDDGGARRVAAERPSAMEASAVGRAVLQALDWRARGAATLVRDRRGVLLGALDAADIFIARDDEAAACIPGPALDALVRAERAPSVRLSIDLRLCRLAREALGAQRGSVVLMDPVTGALRAAVSDARTLAREPGAPFTQLREPASVAKVITTTAVLRAGLDADAAIRGASCAGSRRYGDGTLWCPARAQPLHGLAHAMAISCNLAFADLAVAVGRQALLDEYRRYGFAVAPAATSAATLATAGARDAPETAAGDAATGREAAQAVADDEPPGASPANPGGAIVLVSEGDSRQLADLAIGLQDVAVTPLHGARLGAAFARGALPEVAFVEAADGVLGLTPRFVDAPAPPVAVEARWRQELWPALVAVAEWGTAAGVAPAGFPVAMKTGTASQWRVGYHSNHVGVGPLPDPLVAFSVRVTHQPTSFRAVAAARGVTGRLLDGLARAHGERRLARR